MLLGNFRRINEGSVEVLAKDLFRAGASRQPIYINPPPETYILARWRKKSELYSDSMHYN